MARRVMPDHGGTKPLDPVQARKGSGKSEVWAHDGSTRAFPLADNRRKGTILQTNESPQGHIYEAARVANVVRFVPGRGTAPNRKRRLELYRLREESRRLASRQALIAEIEALAEGLLAEIERFQNEAPGMSKAGVRERLRFLVSRFRAYSETLGALAGADDGDDPIGSVAA